MYDKPLHLTQEKYKSELFKFNNPTHNSHANVCLMQKPGFYLYVNFVYYVNII